jgi:predicted ferric reductase
MRRFIYGILWITLYLSLALAPIVLLVINPGLPGRGFWTELSVALGFAGLAMMGLQFFITARYRKVTSPYGIDVVYHFHRQISIIAFAFILAHPLILFITRPETIALLNIFDAPWRARFGVTSLIFVALLIITSVWRLPLKIRYEPWRISHGIFATAAVTLAMAHVIGVNYYVSIPWKRALWLTLGALWIGSLLYIRVIKPFMMLRRPYVIDEVRPELGSTWSLVLRPDGHKGFNFKPGQFAWLTVLNSPFAIQEHPFSISSSAMKNDRIEMAIKELGDFTSQVKNLKPGTRAYLDGPYGVFTIDDHPAPGYVFLAGGVGITPVMSILRTMADRNDQRPICLIYGSKSWDDMTFREDIENLKEHLNLKVVYLPEKAPENWQGESGFITPDLLARYLPADRHQLEYFICGPDLMLNAVENSLETLGISLEQTNAERFDLV